MVLPSSGLIKFSQIQTEFGGTDPIELSEYYGRSTLPSSGLIKLSDFYGTSASIDYNQLTANASAPADTTKRLHRDTSLQSLLSSTSASSINVTKLRFRTTGYYYGCRDDQNNSSSNYRSFEFGVEFPGSYWSTTATRSTPAFNTCSYETASKDVDLMSRFTTAEQQAFVKNGCPT